MATKVNTKANTQVKQKQKLSALLVRRYFKTETKQ